ncbi:MAG TPA: hypothetical protein VGM77_10335 [Gemmatimonadales bacterium]|jgi:hypothetical protein
MTDEFDPFEEPAHDDEAEGQGRPAAVLAATDRPVPLVVRAIVDDRVPTGMECMGTFVDDTMVARCVVPPGALEYFDEHGVFAEARQLVLAAREEEPGLQCELYAIVPMPSAPMKSDDDAEEPWASSVPSYEAAVGEGAAETDEPKLAAILLGAIVRFRRDRKHPESLPLETIDVLSRIVSGRVVEAVDKVLEDLLGGS